MKKSLLISLTVIFLLLCACSSGENAEYSYAREGLNAYIGQDGRQLIFEDLPESEAEAAVADRYYFEFSRDYDAWLALDKTLVEGTLENTEKAYQEGYYIQTAIIRNLDTIQAADLETDRYMPDYLEILEENHLKEYAFVMATVEQKWSKTDRAPQVGDGEYRQLFLVGKAGSQYYIYQASMR